MRYKVIIIGYKFNIYLIIMTCCGKARLSFHQFIFLYWQKQKSIYLSVLPHFLC